MINLLSNAVKFVTPGSGHIKVGAGGTADDVTVSVADNGPGIKPEDRELVFEKFRQATGEHGALTDKPQGTGLGLPISRQIIEYFGGRLWVESEVGRGSCFLFTLPLKAGDNSHHTNTDKTPGGNHGTQDPDR
jgi:signal transduction histidine kinase